MNPIDMLLDENNAEPIVLYNEENQQIAFDQIAVISLQGKVYAILKPLGDFDGIGEDEALVFVIAEHDGEDVLEVVAETETVDAVFDAYYEMLAEEGIV